MSWMMEVRNLQWYGHLRRTQKTDGLWIYVPGNRSSEERKADQRKAEESATCGTPDKDKKVETDRTRSQKAYLIHREDCTILEHSRDSKRGRPRTTLKTSVEKEVSKVGNHSDLKRLAIDRNHW